MALEKVVLPVYSKTEEILNSVSHGIGVPLGVIFIILGIGRSTSPNTVVASVVLVSQQSYFTPAQCFTIVSSRD